MKKNKLIRALTLVLSLVMLICSAPSPSVFASEEEVDPIFQTAPRLKAASVYADEALTEKIDDLSTLRAGVRYFYTLECEPGEALKSVALIAKEVDSRSFVAPCDGEAAFTVAEAKIIRPGDVDVNNKRNAKDVTTTMHYLVDPDFAPKIYTNLEGTGYSRFHTRDIIASNSDFNLDGKINARDVVGMMRALITVDAAAPVKEKLPGGVQSGFEAISLAGVGGVTVPSALDPANDVSFTVADSDALTARLTEETEGVNKNTNEQSFAFMRSFFSLDGELPALSALCEGLPLFTADKNIENVRFKTVYLPVKAVNDAENSQTVIKLLGVRIARIDDELDETTGYLILSDGFDGSNVLFDSAYFNAVCSTLPAASLSEGCFFDSLRYEVEYVDATELYPPYSFVTDPFVKDERTFNEKEVDYAFDVLRETAKAKGADNIMISPLSLQLCFALAANGAKGETLRGIEEMAGLTLDEMNEALAAFAESIKKAPGKYEDDQERLNVANSAWFRSDLTVNGDYLAAIKEYFDATSETVPFDGTTVEKVNGWVDEETYGMIKKLFDEFPADIAALLVNAVAFEGQWREPFMEFNTKKEKFLSLTGFEREADMLNQTDTMRYLENDVFTGFVKPYTSHYAFVALLPKYCWKPERDIADPFNVLDKLTAESWAQLMSGAITADVTVKLPKFKNEYNLSVTKDLLKDKPLPALFDPLRADLSGMATSPVGNLYASTMEQATFIELDEKGTRAAAVTYMTVADCAPPDYPNKSVILDHPFIYAIIDTNTNIPIFVGTLTDVAPNE